MGLIGKNNKPITRTTSTLGRATGSRDGQSAEEEGRGALTGARGREVVKIEKRGDL